MPEAPDSILLAGLEGEDVLLAPSLPETVSVVLLGNEDADELTGGETEDTLIDGAGDDDVSAGGRDDALPNNGGADQLDAGSGEDLFISNAVCDGDVLERRRRSRQRQLGQLRRRDLDRDGASRPPAWSGRRGSPSARVRPC